MHHPPALGARPQVRRDHARRRPTTASRTARRCRSRSDAGRRSRSTRSSTRSTSRPARRSRSNLRGFGNAFAGRGAPQRGDRRAPAAAARHRPGRAEPVRPATRASTRFFGELGDAARDRRARGRDAGRAVRATSTRRSPRCDTVARPFIQESISEGPAGARRGDPRRSRTSGRSWPTPRACSASCARACARCAPPRPTWPTRSTVGTPTLRRARRRSTAGSRRCSTARDVRRGPAGPARRRGPDRDGRRRCEPTLDFLAPAQTVCNYLDAVVPQRRLAAVARATRNGTWQRFIIIATPQGPNNEGGPSSAPANGPTVGQLPAHQPVPEHRVAGPAEGVRGRQRALRAGRRRSSATCPGTQPATDGGRQRLMATRRAAAARPQPVRRSG